MSTAAETRHKGRIAAMPCVCCELLGQSQESRTEVHHVREGVGMAKRSSDFLTIPLCPDCHRGSKGVHGDKSMLRVLKVTELDLLAATIEALSK